MTDSSQSRPILSKDRKGNRQNYGGKSHQKLIPSKFLFVFNDLLLPDKTKIEHIFYVINIFDVFLFTSIYLKNPFKQEQE